MGDHDVGAAEIAMGKATAMQFCDDVVQFPEELLRRLPVCTPSGVQGHGIGQEFHGQRVLVRQSDGLRHAYDPQVAKKCELVVLVAQAATGEEPANKQGPLAVALNQ